MARMEIKDAMIRGTHGDIKKEVKSKDIKEHISVPKSFNVKYYSDNIEKDDFYNTDWNTVKKYLYIPDRIKFISNLVRILHEKTDLTTITFVSYIETQGDRLFDLYPIGTACWYGGGLVKNNVGLELDKNSIFNAKTKRIRRFVKNGNSK